MKVTLKQHPEGWLLQLPAEAEQLLDRSRQVEIKVLEGGLWIQPIREHLEELEPELDVRGLDRD